MAGLPGPSGPGGRAVTAPAPLRVLVVDDHSVVRRGVVAYLDVLDDIEVAGEATDGRDALDRLAALQRAEGLPPVVLLALQMPRMPALTATAQIAQRVPSVRALILPTLR